MPRGAQVIYPRTIALTVMAVDVRPGITMLEAGVESGALSIALLPVIVFFDEMDSIFRTRGSGVSSDVENTIVPQLLWRSTASSSSKT
jgi:hypothetical protein